MDESIKRSYDSFEELDENMFASDKTACCAGPPELMSGANEVRINRTIADEIRRPPASSSLRFIVFTLPAGNRTVKRFWVVVSKYSIFRYNKNSC